MNLFCVIACIISSFDTVGNVSPKPTNTRPQYATFASETRRIDVCTKYGDAGLIFFIITVSVLCLLVVQCATNRIINTHISLSFRSVKSFELVFVCLFIFWPSINWSLCVSTVFNWFWKHKLLSGLSMNTESDNDSLVCRTTSTVCDRINSHQIDDFNSIRRCVANRSVRFCRIISFEAIAEISDESNTILCLSIVFLHQFHSWAANGNLLRVEQRVLSSYSVYTDICYIHHTVCVCYYHTKHCTDRSMSHVFGLWWSSFNIGMYVFRMHISHTAKFISISLARNNCLNTFRNIFNFSARPIEDHHKT